MKQPIKIAAAAFLAAAILCAPVSALSAQSACVMDAQTGAILYAKNETEPGLIASTTKIMTGLLICEDCDLDAQITVPPEAAGIEGSSMYLEAGVRMRVEDLLCGLSAGNAMIHGLLPDMTMRLFLAHLSLFDQKKLGFADDPDFLHFFFQSTDSFFKTKQPSLFRKKKPHCFIGDASGKRFGQHQDAIVCHLF